MNRLNRMRSSNLKAVWGRALPAISDQLLVAGANFLINVLLARTIALREYGFFATAQAVILLLGRAHESVVTEPMLVFASGRLRDRKSAYLRDLFIKQSLWLLPAGLPLIWPVHYLLAGVTAGSVVTTALAVAPAILIGNAARRAAYVAEKVNLPFLSAITYTAGIAVGYLLIWKRNAISAESVLALMAFASLLSGYFTLAKIGTWSARKRADFPEHVLALHWGYGRWSVLTSIFRWVPSNFHYLLLPVWWGAQAAGEFRAIWNLTTPILLLISAASLALLPASTRIVNTGKSLRPVWIACGMLELCALVSGICLIVAGPEALMFVYGRAFQIETSTLIAIAAIPILTTGSMAFSTVLRAMELPKHILVASVLPLVLSLTLGLALVWAWGVVGAAWSLVLSNVLLVLNLLIRTVRAKRRSGERLRTREVEATGQG